MEEQLNVIST